MPRPCFGQARRAIRRRRAIAPERRPGLLYDADWDEPGRLAAWRDAIDESKRLPPVLAAALAWDAWLVLEPEQRGAWRAPLIAALLLKARSKTTSLLLPIATGQRAAKYRRHPAHKTGERLAGFLQWTIAAAARAGKELDALVLAEALLQPKLARKRRNSRLGALVSLLLSRPLVSAPMAARALGVSPQAVQDHAARACSAGARIVRTAPLSRLEHSLGARSEPANRSGQHSFHG